MMDEMKFRVWWNDQMIYPETEEKPCDWFIDQNGKLQSFPNKLGVVYDPTQFEGAVYMWYTGWRSERYDIYQGDIVRDCDGYIGVVTYWEEEGCWGVNFGNDKLVISEFFQENDLISMGNIYQQPDWENWDQWRVEHEREERKETPEST